MQTLCKKYRQTSTVSLDRIFSRFNLYWFDVTISNSLRHSYLSGTMVLGLAWLDASHSAYELKINYFVSACSKSVLRANFMGASTHTRWWMLKILMLNGLDSRACHSWVWRCIKSVPYIKVKSADYEEKSANNLLNALWLATYVATYWVKCVKICVPYSLMLSDTTIFGICTYNAILKIVTNVYVHIVKQLSNNR